MKESATLDLGQIKKFFPTHRICLLKILLFLVNGILLANSCNLNKIKKKGSIILGKSTNPSNSYARLIRFFKMKGREGFVLGIVQLILSMILPYLGTEAVYCISIDRTNWQLGKVNIK